ncbi:MAG: hypothetical protein K1W40_17950 [Schaedlerella sp.]
MSWCSLETPFCARAGPVTRFPCLSRPASLVLVSECVPESRMAEGVSRSD